LRQIFTCCGQASLRCRAHVADIIAPTEDVITSAFFQGTDFVRGYAGDGRAVHRVSSDNAFEAGPETIYLQFSAADFASITSPVANASLSLTSVSGGFGADASAVNPFDVSVHGVSADPLSSITDDTNPTGPIDWLTFFNNEILTAAPEATTSIDGFGVFEFDVTDVVNDWISGNNTIFALAVTGKNDVQVGNGFLHGFSNNSESPGATFLTVTSVPEPGSLGALLIVSSATGLRRRKR